MSEESEEKKRKGFVHNVHPYSKFWPCLTSEKNNGNNTTREQVHEDNTKGHADADKQGQ